MDTRHLSIGKIKIDKSQLWFLLFQVGVIGLSILLIALILYFSGQRALIYGVCKGVFFLLLRLWIIFAANNYVLVPLLNDSERRTWLKTASFWIANVVLISVLSHDLYFNTYVYSGALDRMAVISYIVFLGMWTGVNFVMIGLAIGRRSYQKQRLLKQKLMEERQKSTDAELSWLKKQLNPHFLFNTLNNISSLTQIDTDMAQDKISQLSDLLRYALYDTREKFVMIGKEVDFMKNYIDLMSLRCGPNVDIQVDCNVADSSLTIAPMLLLSPVENAFKHGVSASRPSFIHIKLNADSDGITFDCCNSNYPKDANNHSGSGIGMENMRRRLELLYKGNYELKQELEGDTFVVSLKIKITNNEED